MLQKTPPLERITCAAFACSKGDVECHNTTADSVRIAIGACWRKYGSALYRPVYYHVECIEAMLDPAEAFFPRFTLDTAIHPWQDGSSTAWGLSTTLIHSSGLARSIRPRCSNHFRSMILEAIGDHHGFRLAVAKDRPVFEACEQKETCRLSDVLGHRHVWELRSWRHLDLPAHSHFVYQDREDQEGQTLSEPLTRCLDRKISYQ